jgi:hypothetical protein
MPETREEMEERPRQIVAACVEADRFITAITSQVPVVLDDWIWPETMTDFRVNHDANLINMPSLNKENQLNAMRFMGAIPAPTGMVTSILVIDGSVHMMACV